MSKVRFRFTKTGKAKYISHLDLIATMQRALLRAGDDLKYSEGFNPQPYMAVALPLSLGSESICELLDVGIISDNLPDIEKRYLPDGLTILDIYKPTRKFNEIAWVEVKIIMYYNNDITATLIERLHQRFSENSIIISKKTKRGTKELNIAPYLKDFEFISNGFLTMSAKMSAQNPTINTIDIENALSGELKPEFTEIKRISVYDSSMIEFI